MGREPEAGDSAGGSSEVDYMAVLAVMSDPDARHKQRMRWVDEGRITIAQAADDLRATEAAEQSASHTADLDAAGGAGAAAQPSGIAGARWASAAELDDEDED